MIKISLWKLYNTIFIIIKLLLDKKLGKYLISNVNNKPRHQNISYKEILEHNIILKVYSNDVLKFVQDNRASVLPARPLVLPLSARSPLDLLATTAPSVRHAPLCPLLSHHNLTPLSAWRNHFLRTIHSFHSFSKSNGLLARGKKSCFRWREESFY